MQGQDAEIMLEVLGDAEPVLLLHIAALPKNALLPGLRHKIAAALRGPGADLPVVIRSAGPHFAPATYLDHGAALYDGKPSLAALCQQIEDHPRPVIALLQGRVSGPGAELALAAHGRVAGAKLRMNFPELGLGLAPAAGSTQRLPRLVGITAALRLLLQAASVDATSALALGLLDAEAGADPLATALALARAKVPPLPAKSRAALLQDGAAYAKVIATAREEYRLNPLPAPKKLIDSLEAALYLLPENGYALEAVAHEDLRATPEAQGLIAAAQAERIAMPMRRSEAPPIRVLGLVGSKAAQAGLAMLAIGRGIEVIWCDPDAAAHRMMVDWLTERLRIEAEAGRISAAQVTADRLRLHDHASLDDLAAAEVVLHAEAPDLAGLPPGALHLTLAPAQAEGLASLSLHHSGRSAEIGPDAALSTRAQAQVAQLMQQLDLQAILTAGQPVLGRNLWTAGRAALLQLLLSGVPREALDAALLEFGQAPYELAELAVTLEARAMSARDIQNRWLGAMAAEGLRLLGSRKVDAPAVLDFIMVSGFDFPRWRGGPMHQAAERGLMVLRADLRRWQQEAKIWTVPQLLDRLIDEDLKLADLNAL